MKIKLIITIALAFTMILFLSGCQIEAEVDSYLIMYQKMWVIFKLPILLYIAVMLLLVILLSCKVCVLLKTKRKEAKKLFEKAEKQSLEK